MHPAWRSQAEEPNNSIYSATLLAFTSDFLSFIVVEHIWFFHGALQLFRGGLLVNICTVRLFVSWCAVLLAWQCAKCENEAKLYCCWSTSYCSVLCQKEHWEHEHSSQCRHKQQTVLPTLSAQNCCWLRLSLSLSLSLSLPLSLYLLCLPLCPSFSSLYFLSQSVFPCSLWVIPCFPRICIGTPLEGVLYMPDAFPAPKLMMKAQTVADWWTFYIFTRSYWSIAIAMTGLFASEPVGTTLLPLLSMSNINLYST